jgi:hypothetical protein
MKTRLLKALTLRKVLVVLVLATGAVPGPRSRDAQISTDPVPM